MTCKGLLRAAVFFAFLFVPFLAVAADAPPSGQPDLDVDFHWAFAALTERDGKTAVQPIERDTALRSGDRLKMMVELQRRCFVYVFHYNPRDGLKLLFPYAFPQFDTDYRLRQRYYVPRGDAWFRLDRNTGQEVFYLIASAKRLEELEKAYLRYEAAGPASAPEAARAVLDQIRELRKQHREISSPAERPIPIGGAVRGVQPVAEPDKFDVAAFADQVLSTGFVARTFTIEHK